MNRIIKHIWSEIRFENIEILTPVFDKEKPIRTTSDVKTWYTSKKCERVKKSHISHCVYDSDWEEFASRVFDNSGLVDSYVKNDHLGFVIHHNFNGVIRKYYPDFILKLTNQKFLVLEIKGVDSLQNQAKREYLDKWVQAVNNQGGFGRWSWDVSFNPSDIKSKVEKHFIQ